MRKTLLRAAGLAMLGVAAAWVFVEYAHAAAAESGPWWNPKWQHRLAVALPSSMEGEAATVYVDFAALLKELEPGSKPDLGSIRVVETAAQKGRPPREIPCLVEERIGRNAGWAWITWLRNGGRRYQIYFNALKDAAGLPQPRAAEPHGHVPPELAAHSVNIVPNPGFEEARLDDKRLPAEWGLAGQDLATKKWSSDYDFISLVYTWSEEQVHSGRKSLKLDLAKAMGKWFDQGVGLYVPDSRVLPLRGRIINLRVFAYLEDGSGIVRIRLNNWGKTWLKEIRLPPAAERKGEWLAIAGSGTVHEEATRLQMASSDLLSRLDKDLVYYLDDFNVQAEGEELIHVALDKQSYYLSDRKADVLVRPAIGRESVVCLSATAQKRQLPSRPFTVQLKVTASEAMLAGKKIRLTIESKEQTLVAQEVQADTETRVALDISRLGAGSYALVARIVDCDAMPEAVMKPLVRIAGPFD